jgi:hypothetical protein
MIGLSAAARAGAVDRSPLAATVAIGWLSGGLLVIAFGVALAAFSPRFGYAYDVAEMPVLWLAVGLVLAGLVYALRLPPLINQSLAATGARYG